MLLVLGLVVRDGAADPPIPEPIAPPAATFQLAQTDRGAPTSLADLRAQYESALRTAGPDHPQTLELGNALAMSLTQAGLADEAEPIALATLEARQRRLGPNSGATLQSLHTLAFVWLNQDRFTEAEGPQRQVLERGPAVLGDGHIGLALAHQNMATILFGQGRYEEALPEADRAVSSLAALQGPAAPLVLQAREVRGNVLHALGRLDQAAADLRSVLEGYRAHLAADHVLVIRATSNLAAVLSTTGRHAEAEGLYEEALAATDGGGPSRAVRRSIIVGNLAELYSEAGRLEEALALQEDLVAELRRSREALLETPTAIANLAVTYLRAGRVAEADRRFAMAAELLERRFPEHRPHLAAVLDNWGQLALAMGDGDTAERRALQAFEIRKEAFGADHPSTLASRNNLGLIRHRAGDTKTAEADYRAAYEGRRATLGAGHPQTTASAINLAALLGAGQRPSDAAAVLDAALQPALRWAQIEVRATSRARLRRHVANRQAGFEDAVLSLAIAAPGQGLTELAAKAALSWTRIAGEEDARLAALLRRVPTDSDEAALINRAIASRDALARAFARDIETAGDGAALRGRLAALEDAERQLRETLGQDIVPRQVLDPAAVAARLAPRSIAILLRAYLPFDLHGGTQGEPRIAGLALTPEGALRIADLGRAAPLQAWTRALTRRQGGLLTELVSDAVFPRLFAAFDKQIANATRVIVAPDSFLQLIPFGALRLPNGERWLERQDVRIVHDPRELMQDRAGPEARGLIAVGGVDYGPGGEPASAEACRHAKPDPAAPTPAAPTLAATQPGVFAAALRRRVESFAALPGSLPEALAVSRRFTERTGEAAQVLCGKEAGEAALKALPAPRVLHLASHGVFLARESALDRPYLLSGIALAGANRQAAEGTEGQDGILWSIEAAGLNLEGTELVVLSACDTGQGAVDSSDGVYSLGSALRLAGAEAVLMTLWPVGDRASKDFMERFYGLWLAEPGMAPAAALRQTQRDFIAQGYGPGSWAGYVLSGGHAREGDRR